jgi:hypothetical protein
MQFSSGLHYKPIKSTNKQISTSLNNSLKKIQQEGTLIF